MFQFRVRICKISSRRYSSAYSMKTVLSEENVKKTIAKFSTMKPIRFQSEEPTKRAAVLVPVCVVDKKVSLLYTKRAASLKAHGGQVSFPGGLQEMKDSSLEETALRETEEELGINREAIDVWGRGNFVVQRREMGIMPVAGLLNFELEMSDLTVNPNEVEEVFTVPLEDLCNPTKIHYTQFRTGYSAPVFTGGKLRIWGLTALITDVFLRALLPHNAYSNRIKYVPEIKTSSNLKRRLATVQL